MVLVSKKRGNRIFEEQLAELEKKRMSLISKTTHRFHIHLLPLPFSHICNVMPRLGKSKKLQSAARRDGSVVSQASNVSSQECWIDKDRAAAFCGKRS